MNWKYSVVKRKIIVVADFEVIRRELAGFSLPAFFLNLRECLYSGNGGDDDDDDDQRLPKAGKPSVGRLPLGSFAGSQRKSSWTQQSGYGYLSSCWWLSKTERLSRQRLGCAHFSGIAFPLSPAELTNPQVVWPLWYILLSLHSRGCSLSSRHRHTRRLARSNLGSRLFYLTG